jgi:hypothetical protein
MPVPGSLTPFADGTEFWSVRSESRSNSTLRIPKPTLAAAHCIKPASKRATLMPIPVHRGALRAFSGEFYTTLLLKPANCAPRSCLNRTIAHHAFLQNAQLRTTIRSIPAA